MVVQVVEVVEMAPPPVSSPLKMAAVNCPLDATGVPIEEVKAHYPC
jgi:hypothetical protein